MKLLFIILLPFFSFAQQSTYKQGDSAWLVSSDTNKVKVYKSDTWEIKVEKFSKVIKNIDNKTRLYVENGLPNYKVTPIEIEAHSVYDTLPKEIGKWSYKDKDSNIISVYDALKLDSVQRCTILSADSRVKSFLPEKNKTTIEYKSGEIWVFTNDGSKLPVKRPQWHRYRAWNVDTTGVEIVTTQEDGVQIFGEDISSGYTIGYNTIDSAWLADVRIYTSKPAEYTYDEVYYGHPKIQGSEHWVIRDPKTEKWKESDKNGKIIHTPQSKEIYRRENGKPYVYKPRKAERAPSIYHTDKPKYDTIGPVWKIISHTGPGYNPAMAAQVYEVRIYNKEVGDVKEGSPFSFPHHFGWLGADKKPLRYKVWETKL